MKKIIILASIVATFTAFALPLILIKLYGADFEKLGQYGDFFGSFNALVSLLAFGGLIYTIHLQRKDLELQREELKLTREELKRQAAAQEKTAQEQERHAKILEDQLNKEIRPYLNTYFTHENHQIFLVVKNIGKSACYNFSATIETYSAENEYAESLLEEIKKNVEEAHYSVIQPGLDYAIECNIKDIDIECGLMNSSITVLFIFHFKDKEEKFKITFKFNEIQYHGNPVAKALFAIANRLPNRFK